MSLVTVFKKNSKSDDELCPYCQKEGRCWFREKANNIAMNVPKNPATPEEELANAQDANQRIGNLRDTARAIECPNVNDINPGYKGIEKL